MVRLRTHRQQQSSAQSVDGRFRNSERIYHCLGTDCMGWRELHLSHLKGGDDGLTAHGTCGYAGRSEHG